MPNCDQCNEPAVKSFVFRRREDSDTEEHFCYVHANEQKLLDIPLDKLCRVSEKTGHTINGIAFVLESALRADILGGKDLRENLEISARERFGDAGPAILRDWGILEPEDVVRVSYELSVERLLHRDNE